MKEIDYLKEKTEILESDSNETKEYFDNKSNAVIKKCIRQIDKAMRNENKIPCILSDDYDYLNTFEQICLIQQEYNEDDYWGLETYIDGTVEILYDKLSIDEKFILNHGNSEEPLAEIRSQFNRYCCLYTNKNIRRAIYE